MNTYRTLTGRVFDLDALKKKERLALAEIESAYRRRPTWTEFASIWPTVLRTRVWGRGKPAVGTPLYRICQDLESRLGIAAGMVAPPDYRDFLSDRIEEKFGSRYAFCKATGIDQGNLSHVLAGRRDFSIEVLEKAVQALDAQIDLVTTADLHRKATVPGDDPTDRLRELSYEISTLENLRARAAEVSPRKRTALVPATSGLFPDGLDALRMRLRNGQAFDTALTEELGRLLEEQARLARHIAESADTRRESVVG